MTGIFYFSATGNSLYISQKIREKMGGKIIYIPTYMGNGNEFDKIIVVSPIYSSGLPVHVYDFLPRLDNERELFIVLNYGGMVGGADYFVYAYSRQKGLNVKGIFALKMPENYTLTFTVPKFYLKRVLNSADKRIDRVISKITCDEPTLPRKKKTKEKIYYKNKANWHLIGERFWVSEDCIGCGKCIGLCPAQNISMENGKITFGNACVACLGCYHRCPQKAIRYLRKKKKDRYINPCIDEKLIGKNID